MDLLFTLRIVRFFTGLVFLGYHIIVFFIFHYYTLIVEYMCSEGPWSIDGALLVLEKRRPNLVLSKLHLNFVSI